MVTSNQICPQLMGRLFFLLLLSSLAFFLLTGKVLASATVSNIPSSINSDQEIEVQVELSLQGQDNKKYFLEGALKKDDGSSYFGLTFNDSDWVAYTSSNFSSLKVITTDSNGNWSGSLKFKVDSLSSDYKGSGNYVFQVKRFTEAGSNSWLDTSATIAITAVEPSPSPTPEEEEVNSISTPAESAPISFSQTPDQLLFFSSNNINVTVQVNGLAANTKYYFKPALYQSGSSNYFGLTKVGSAWIKNSQSYSDQFSVMTDSSGNWTGEIEFKVDPEDSGFNGTGDYILKVGRYSATGTGPTWSNQTTVNVTDDTPEPTSTPSSSSPISSHSTSSPKPTVTAAPKASPNAANFQSAGGSLANLLSNGQFKLPSIGTVSAESTKSGKESVLVKGKQQVNWLVFIFGGGLILVSFAAAFYYFKIR
jgi:hypothetical protein